MTFVSRASQLVDILLIWKGILVCMTQPASKQATSATLTCNSFGEMQCPQEVGYSNMTHTSLLLLYIPKIYVNHDMLKKNDYEGKSCALVSFVSIRYLQ